MAQLIRPSQIRPMVRRLALRAAAAGLGATAGLFLGIAASLALFGLLQLWLQPLWAAVGTFVLMALGLGTVALLLAALGRPPPPPAATFWDWLLAGDPDGRPDGGLRRWAWAAVREWLRRPRGPRSAD